MDISSLRNALDLPDVARSYGITLLRQGPRWLARCPFHDDHNPSFSIYCHEGRQRCGCFACRWDGDVLDFIQKVEGLPDIKSAIRRAHEICGIRVDPAPPPDDSPLVRPGRIVKRYPYVDAGNKLLFEVVRRELLDASTHQPLAGRKTFMIRRPSASGSWIWSLGSTARVLYRLPRVLRSQAVVLCEGEKDTEAVERVGLTATTNSGGAKAAWEPQYTAALQGRHVVIIPDKDEPGLERAHVVASAIRGRAASVTVIYLPSTYKDVAEFLESGNRLADLSPFIFGHLRGLGDGRGDR